MTRLFAILLIVLTGCGAPARDPSVIEFWTIQLSPTFDPFIRSLIGEFERSHAGTTVRWVDVPFDGITQKFLSSIAAGQSPDVINLPGDYVQKYVHLGALAGLEPLLSEEARAPHLPAALRSLTAQDSLYGVPWYLATKIMIYDREKLARAGFPRDSVPTSFDGLLDFAKAFRKHSRSYGFFYNLVVDSYLYQVLVSEGVPLISDDGKQALFNSEDGKQVIRRWVETFRAGAMPRECLFEGHQGGIAAYQSGTVAMFVGAPQFLRIIKENSPTIYANTGVAPSVAGRTGKTELDVMALSVSSNSVNSRLAGEFAAFVTNKENQLRFARLVPIFPSHREALNDPFFGREDGTLEATARVIAARQIRNAEVLKPSLRNYQRLNNVFKDELLPAFLGNADAGIALDAAAVRWTKLLQEEW